MRRWVSIPIFKRSFSLKLGIIGLLALYACLSLFLFFCTFHHQGGDHGHYHGFHGLCTWVQKIASTHLISASPILTVLGSLALSGLPRVLLCAGPFLQLLSIRAPPVGPSPS